MRMNDIDFSISNQAPKSSPHSRVEGAAFEDFRVSHPRLPRCSINLKDSIPGVPEVTNGHGKSRGIGPDGALKDCLLRSAAGAADAPEFQDMNGASHAETCAVR